MIKIISQVRKIFVFEMLGQNLVNELNINVIHYIYLTRQSVSGKRGYHQYQLIDLTVSIKNLILSRVISQKNGLQI